MREAFQCAVITAKEKSTTCERSIVDTLFFFLSLNTHDTRTLIIAEFVGTNANSCANKREKKNYVCSTCTGRLWWQPAETLFFSLFLCFFFLLSSAMYWGCIFVEMMTFKNKKKKTLISATKCVEFCAVIVPSKYDRHKSPE